MDSFILRITLTKWNFKAALAIFFRINKQTLVSNQTLSQCAVFVTFVRFWQCETSLNMCGVLFTGPLYMLRCKHNTKLNTTAKLVLIQPVMQSKIKVIYNTTGTDLFWVCWCRLHSYKHVHAVDPYCNYILSIPEVSSFRGVSFWTHHRTAHGQHCPLAFQRHSCHSERAPEGG